MTNESHKVQLELGVTDGTQEGLKSVEQNLDRATRRMAAGIKRVTAETNAFASGATRNSRAWFEAMAEQKGISKTALEPFLQQLDKANAATQKATGSVNNLGMSAKQTTAALRQVPMQFTDIVVSLSGGQSAMQVLMQQGGQLKDIFGGVGAAARALGGYILGLITPFNVAIATMGGLAYAYYKGSQEADNFAKALIATNNAAGTTVGRLQLMAERISTVVGTESDAAEALTAIISTGVGRAGDLERMATVAVRMSRVMGQSAEETAKQFAELARSPLEASLKYNESANYLTLTLYEQIKALQDQGREFEASSLAVNTWADAQIRAVNKVEGRLGTIEKLWKGIKDAVGKGVDFAMSIGREPEDIAKLRKLRQFREDLMKGENTAASVQAVDLLIANLEEAVRLEGRIVGHREDEARLVKDRALWDKQSLEFMSKQERLHREIVAAINLAKSADVEPEELTERLNNLRRKYIDTDAIAEQKKRLAIDLQEIKGEYDKYADGVAAKEKELEGIRSAGMISDQDYFDRKRENIKDLSAERESQLFKELSRLSDERYFLKQDQAEIEKQRKRVMIDLDKNQADATGKLIELQVKETAAINSRTASLIQARQAMEDYYDLQVRASQRELAAIGTGNVERERANSINQIDERWQAQRRQLQNSREVLVAQHKFTQDEQRAYAARLIMLETFYQADLDAFNKAYDKKMAKQEDWHLGFKESMINYLDDIRNTFKSVGEIAVRAFKGMEDAFVEFAMSGKFTFKEFANSVIADLIRIGVQKNITTQLLSAAQATGWPTWLSWLVPNAKGGIYESPSLSTYSGGVYDKPKLFTFAKGAGIFGEAGPEAIMPLTRNNDGTLGVKGTGSNVVVNVIESPGQGGQQTRRNENGVDVITIMVDKIKSSIASDIMRGNGAVPQALGQTYGLNRAVGAY